MKNILGPFANLFEKLPNPIPINKAGVEPKRPSKHSEKDFSDEFPPSVQVHVNGKIVDVLECKICNVTIKGLKEHIWNVHRLREDDYMERVKKMERGEDPGELPSVETTECKVCKRENYTKVDIETKPNTLIKMDLVIKTEIDD